MPENTKKNLLSSKRENYSVANTNIIAPLVEPVQSIISERVLLLNALQ